MGTNSRIPNRHGPIVVGALVLVLCALVAATFDGPRWTGFERAEQPPASTPDGAPAEDDPEPATDDSPPAEDDDEPWLPWVPRLDLLLLVPSALIFGVALLVLARLRLRRRRRQLTGQVGPRHSPMLGPEAPADDEESGLAEALDEVSRTIGEGPPRNAIVAAWVRLERAIEGARFPHRPEETPSELVERALASYRLDTEAIRRLAALYREARFSTHRITESQRDEAAACLRRLLASLGSGAR